MFDPIELYAIHRAGERDQLAKRLARNIDGGSHGLVWKGARQDGALWSQIVQVDEDPPLESKILEHGKAARALEVSKDWEDATAVPRNRGPGQVIHDRSTLRSEGEATGQSLSVEEEQSDQATIKELAVRARRFSGHVVVAELVKAGLYAIGQGLTPSGEAARDELESRMGGVLREMQLRRGSWVTKEPRQALMAAALAVSLGRRRPPADADTQLVERQLEQGKAMNGRQPEAHLEDEIPLDLHLFDQFESYFHAVDAEMSAGEAGGDGSNGGGGGDGGGGGGE